MSALKNFFRPLHVDGTRIALRDVFKAPYLRLAVITSVAGTLGYFIGGNVPRISGTTAAITAIVSVRHTFHESIREGVNQVIGVVIGGTVAFSVMKLTGFSWTAVLVAILSCFIAARLLKLGEEGAIALAVTVILVVGPYVSTDTIESRFYGVLLGAALAIIGSYFVRIGSPQSRALKAGIAQAHALARLLDEISKELIRNAGRVEPQLAVRWLSESEFISNEVDAALEAAESALAGSYWSPVISRKEAASIVEQVKLTEATAETVKSICRELLVTSGRTQKLPELLATALSGVLRATAGVIHEQAHLAAEQPAALADDDNVDWDRKREDAVERLKSLDETQPLLLGGSILRDAEKITETLSD